jgi:hypothetical protein
MKNTNHKGKIGEVNYGIRTFVNVTMYPQHNNTFFKKKLKAYRYLSVGGESCDVCLLLCDHDKMI